MGNGPSPRWHPRSAKRIEEMRLCSKPRNARKANREVVGPGGRQCKPRAWIWSMRFLYRLVMAYARTMVRTMTATVIRAFVTSV